MDADLAPERTEGFKYEFLEHGSFSFASRRIVACLHQDATNLLVSNGLVEAPVRNRVVFIYHSLGSVFLANS